MCTLQIGKHRKNSQLIKLLHYIFHHFFILMSKAPEGEA